MEVEIDYKLRCELHGHQEDVSVKSVGTSPAVWVWTMLNPGPVKCAGPQCLRW